MVLELDETVLSDVRNYRLPSYSEIPDVGLYLNQTVSYINRFLTLFPGFSITESMVSNYVKNKLADNPVKKQYSRDMICSLLFIAVSKSIASLDDIRLLLTFRRESGYGVEEAYAFFKREFELSLASVFGFACERAQKEETESAGEELLDKLTSAVAHKIYVEAAFSVLKEKKDGK